MLIFLPYLPVSQHKEMPFTPFLCTETKWKLGINCLQLLVPFFFQYINKYVDTNYGFNLVYTETKKKPGAILR